MRVLLIKPYQSVPGWVSQPPLGLLYLVSALREKFGAEAEVQLIDMKSLRVPPEWVGARLAEFRPDVVGVSALNCEASAAHRIAEIAKTQDPKVVAVLGGPYAHRRAREILERGGFDWVFDGPAERSFPTALERLFGAGELGDDIPGLSYRRDGELRVSDTLDIVRDLDSLPKPAWDVLDFDRYAAQKNMMLMLRGQRYAPIFTSRGCPYKCSYCHNIFGKRFYHRSVEDVIQEIELLYERYGVDEFQIIDDIFNLHRPRLKAIMAEVSRRWPGRLHFSFPNGVRADLLDESVLDALREAGTYAMCVAIETATPRLQRLVEKDLKLDKVRAMIDAADRRGIAVVGFFMLGFPTETREELEDTLQLALESRLSLAHFFCVVPQPGTSLYRLAQQECGEALEIACRAEEEGANYRAGDSWYQQAYGFPLNQYIRSAYRRFYLSPSRAWRILRRVPPRSALAGLGEVASIVALNLARR